MRTFRNRTTVLAASATAALALTLTACGGGDGAADAKSAGSAAESSASAASHGGSGKNDAKGDSGKNDSKSGSKGGDAGTGGASAHGGSGKGATGGDSAVKASTGGGSQAAQVCTTKDVRISAAYRGGAPYTHIVLTAKNTSGHSCTMRGFPRVQFLESHKQDVPAVAKSKPAAPVVLPAGAPAYALVKLSDGGKDEYTEPVTAFSVMLQGGNGQAAVRAPGSGIAVDPAKWATGYWTPELRNGADDF
ncbi:DUF4232 domain-containing protein [Streptomyces sp. NPDC087300]|uniref:DUF4232 domain-containing protein n=1 Tax=Streptomyces sp. NPDC087300 TaxID=3365780 RepID=UPI0038229478